jgi:hypothetical protein
MQAYWKLGSGRNQGNEVIRHRGFTVASVGCSWHLFDSGFIFYVPFEHQYTVTLELP